MSDLLTTLLSRRGIIKPSEIEAFLRPNYKKHLHDPFLMKDMKKVVQRVLRAIEKDETILIYSDYDADGIPGAVVLHDFFKKINYKNFKNYIPHRHNEGFGLNSSAVEQFAKEGIRVLITIDCGIADVAEVTLAQKLGIDVIITDHHIPPEKMPPAFAILNPKQRECEYPEKMLCGSGVIFKFVQAMVFEYPHLTVGWEKWLLDMVGVATLSDMVPLTGENRVLAYYGLLVLRKSPRVGVMKLFRKLGTRQRFVTEDDIGFSLSPRINAASRMGVPYDAFLLLSTSDEAEADILSTRLDTINDERKGLVAAMVKEMKQKLRKRFSKDEKPKVIVLGNSDWKPSLLGLAANTLMDEYSCPVFLWGRDGEGVLKGSCRSDGSVSLQDLMRSIPDLSLMAYGGHDLAGGFVVGDMEVLRLEEDLIRAYDKLTEQSKKTDGVKSKYVIDADVALEDISWGMYETIEQLSPFGVGNPKPLFIFKNIIVHEVKHFGKEQNHLSLTFRRVKGGPVSAISFFTKAEDWNLSGRTLCAGVQIDLVAHVEKSTFRSSPELRLRIVDIL